MVFDQAISVCTAPGANGCADPWWPGVNGNPGVNANRNSNGNNANELEPLGSGDDPLDLELENDPTVFNSGRGPGSRPSTSSSGGNNQGFNKPAGGGFQAAVGGPFEGGSAAGGLDPLDSEFGGDSPSSGGSSGSSENNSGGDTVSCEIFSRCKNKGGKNGGSSEAQENKPNWGSGSENPGGKKGKNNNNPNGDSNESDFNWDKEEANSNGGDWWGTNNLAQQGNRPRPSGANWGGANKPGNSNLGNMPWRPSTTWVSASNNDNNGASSSSGQGIGGNKRPSWWDPPFALPRRPTSSMMRPPLHEPWANPFRQRYPTYQIVAYPTWPPGPYGQRPILVVYSNSKK